MNDPAVHIGRVAFDFEILRSRDDSAKTMVLQQSRRGELHRLMLKTQDGADLVGGILEAAATAHPLFFDREVRPLLQQVLDERTRWKRSGGA